MTTRPWKRSGARSNGKHWSQAPVGPKTECGGRSSNTLKPFTTGAGSTALWGINHLWTSNTKTIKNEKDSSTCVHKKGGREQHGFACSPITNGMSALECDYRSSGSIWNMVLVCGHASFP